MERIELFPERPLKERGYQEPRKERVASMISFMCYRGQGALFRHKLHKLLFFADLLHFGSVGRTISGLCYFDQVLGPIPERGDLLLELLVLEERIVKKDMRFPASDYYGTAFLGGSSWDPALLDEEERSVLDEIVRAYKQATPQLLIEESRKADGSFSPPFLL